MTGNLVEVILRLRDEASGALRQVAQAAEQARARIGSLSDNLAQVSHGLQGLGSSLGALLGSAGLTYALKSAADAAFEAQAGTQVLARTAAMAGVDFRELRSTLDPLLESLGVLPEQAAQATAQLLRAGFSVEQIAQAFEAGAASALAAGRTAAEGIENVAMALATGQSIYLNYIGIAENIGPVMQQVASSMKGASEEAIKAAQNQAALNVILQATAGEVAALPAFLQGYAAAQNRLNASLYEFRTAIGNAVLPYLTALYDLLAEGVEWFNSLGDSTKRAIGTGAVAAAGILGLGTAMGLLLPVIQNAITVFRGLAGALLTLASNPITLVVAGAAAIAVAWARSADTADETRKRWTLLAQAAIGLYDILKGVAQSIAGLFSSVGQLFSTFSAAFSKVLKGDFVGAWQEVQRGINLEVFAAKFEAANRSLTQGWRNLSSTVRGEVLDSTNQILGKFQGLVDKVRETTKITENLTDKLPDYSRAVSQAAGTSEKKERVTKSLTDALDVLKKRYELGQISLDQYLANLRSLLSRWETHLQGLKVGTDEWKRYADAVLAAKRAIEEATTAASRVMTGPEVKGVEGWRVAILDTIRLGSTAYGQLMAQISALEARLARGGLSAQAEAELRAILEAAQRTAREWEDEILKAFEAEDEEKLARARALGQSLGEEIAQGIEEGLTSTQLDIIAKIREELETQRIDPRGALEADLSQLQAGLRLGDIAPEEYAARLREIIDTYRSVLADLYRSGEVDAGTFLQSSEQLDRLQKEWEELALTAQGAARIAEEAASNQMRIISEVMAEAEKAGQIDIPGGLRDLLQGPLYSVLTAVQTGALSASEGIYALYDAAENAQRTLTALYEAGEISAEEFQRGTQSLALYEGAIADLRMQVLQSIGPIVELGNAAGEMDEDFAPALTAAMSRLDEFRGYLDAIAQIEDPVERLRQLADLEEWLASAMPGLEELIRALEGAGINADIVLEVLKTLVQRMRELGDESKRVQMDREAQRWTDGLRSAANAIQELHSGLMAIADAFNAPTFGQALARFAGGFGQLVALIPGRRDIGGLIGAVGGFIGSIWDGIASVFDSGWGRAQAKIREATAKWDLVDPALAQRAVEQYTESYLFGLIRTTKYRVNEDLLKQIQEAARTAENAVQGGLQAALNAAARGEDWRGALQQSLYSTTLNAVASALMQSEAINAALGPLTTALAEAILSGSTEAITAATTALAQGMEALAPLFESLGQALGEFLPRQLSEAGKSIRDLTASLEGGITGAVKSALQAGLRGEDWQVELSSRIQEGILSAVVDTAITQAVVQGALGPLINEMVGAILTADWQAVSTLSGMITTQTEVLVDGLLQGVNPLVRVFSNLSQSATRASESLERVADSAANLPSWYRLDVARERAERVIVVNVQGSIYGIDDLRRALAEAERVERLAYGRW